MTRVFLFTFTYLVIYLSNFLTYFLAYLQKQQVVTSTIAISKHLTALYFYDLIRVFCTQFICFVFDGFL